MKKLGVSVTVVHEGTFKDAGSPFRSVTATEKVMLLQDLKPAYDQFIAAVAKGRKLPESKVRAMATGWVWPGVTAKDMGLVDVLGNYADAVTVAGRAGGLGDEPQVIDYDATDIFGVLGRLVGAVERLGAPSALGGTVGGTVPR
jgi:protease-4